MEKNYRSVQLSKLLSLFLSLSFTFSAIAQPGGGTGGGGTGGGGMGGGSGGGMVTETIPFTYNELYIPDTLTGPIFDLEFQESTVNFYGDTEIPALGINTTTRIGGPVLIWNKGEEITLNVKNSITSLENDTTTCHWHGAHVSPADDGGPHSKIYPGETWSVDFEVLDHATTLWYHPHFHEITEEQVAKGLAGMIIVRDDEEAALNLPREYGVNDIPCAISDIGFSNGEIDYVGGTFYTGGNVLVNGTMNAVTSVPASLVRLRLLNASASRIYTFGLSSDDNFDMIASDGGLLESPVSLNRLTMYPGERSEIVIDMSAVTAFDTLFLMSYSSEYTIAAAPGTAGAPQIDEIDGTDYNILGLRMDPSIIPSQPVMSLPQVLTTHNIPDESEATVTRYFDLALDGGQQVINGILYDHYLPNDTVELGATEIWEITADGPHPFHVHDVQFYIIEYAGHAPADEWAGRKDVVQALKDSTVRFIATFDDFADDEIPYMYHCHFLYHEDEGMMNSFIVKDTAKIITGTSDVKEYYLNEYATSVPNPISCNGKIEYTLSEASNVTIYLISPNGEIVDVIIEDQPSEEGVNYINYDASSVASGNYFLKVVKDNGYFSIGKIVITK